MNFIGRSLVTYLENLRIENVQLTDTASLMRVNSGAEAADVAMFEC